MSIRIENLQKTYDNGTVALNNISLEIPKGMYGLLGPNGAGKSTLMRTIATLQKADHGSIYWNNVNVFEHAQEFREVLGYLPQEFGVYPRANAYDLLNHLSILKGIVSKKERKETIEALLERVNLFDSRKKSVSNFSGGMKQRFGIAQALIGNPEVIIVDEPTAGLDPGERNRFYNLLSEIGENVVVILSTHIVQDVQQLCKNMAIINKGELLFEGETNKAIDSIAGKVWQKSIRKAEVEAYANNYNVISRKLIMGQPIIHVFSDEDLSEDFIQVHASLEDVFFSNLSSH